MNNRIETICTGFLLIANSLTDDKCINETKWNIYEPNKYYRYIKKIDTPCCVTASYELNFCDGFSLNHEIIHTVKRKITFYIVSNDMATAKTNIKTIQQNLKSQKKSEKKLIVINTAGDQVYPKHYRRSPAEIYNFFNKIYDYER